MLFHRRGLVRILRASALALIAGSCSRSATTVPSGPSGPPQHVLAASSTASDIVCALLEPARVAGVPEQAQEYSVLHDGAAAWAATPRFSIYLAEPVLALRPDLVIVDPWQSPDTSERLRSAGVDVLELPRIDTFAQARAALLKVGARLGESARAEELARALDARVEALRAKAGARGGLRALVYSNFGAQGWTAGSQTTIDEILRLAGLVNAAAEKGRVGHQTLSFEELLALDPDVIIVGRPLAMAAGSAGDRGGASEELLLGEPALASLRAIRERRIVALPAWLFATGSHEMVTGAEFLAAEIDRMLARPAAPGATPRATSGARE